METMIKCATEGCNVMTAPDQQYCVRCRGGKRPPRPRQGNRGAKRNNLKRMSLRRPGS